MATGSDASREAILGTVRRGLRRGVLPADQAAMLDGRLATHPRHLIPARARLSGPERVAAFVKNVEKEFGTVERVEDAASVPAAIADYLAAQNLEPRFVLAPHPDLAALPWAERPMLAFEVRRAVPGDAVSVQHAWAGVAETGTLVFPSGPERPTTLNILPETEIAVLRASDILGAYEEAWDRLRAERGGAEPNPNPSGGFMPRNVMLVTGPSRSADIEQTLELGAHGPRRLHVILIEDAPAARTELSETADPRPAAAREPIARPGEIANPAD
ncbi:LutC/YkgG family protein [Pararoseomonas indoligenes]|uniref:Lactate utilization protein n=1 Tax=Roseomonas indoligenes TaxID=2820811 RepID=A0A940S4W1_9PROT|nr:lactate utilization protein [Pararoseomonas indoligenes]MBP0493736.1 lactate utilization protein [Pararoseomonas indoligenes]